MNRISQNLLLIVLGQVEQLEGKISLSTSQLTDLRGRYDKQSGGLTDVRKDLEESILSIKSKDHNISTLTAKIVQLEAEAADKAEQVSELGLIEIYPLRP